MVFLCSAAGMLGQYNVGNCKNDISRPKMKGRQRRYFIAAEKERKWYFYSRMLSVMCEKVRRGREQWIIKAVFPERRNTEPDFEE